jgi:hypothetical protein
MGDWRSVQPTEWLASDSYSIEKLAAYAKAKDAKCLSVTYIGVKGKYRWCCANGHVWDATWDSLKNQDSWCPVCSGNVIPDALLDLQKIAESRGGKLVSTDFLGMQKKHRWQCSLGHEWQATPSSIKHSKSWCPVCAGHVLIEPLKQLKDIANIRGGMCLSAEYVSNTTKLRWRCAEEHEWEAVPSSIKSGKWCPVCAIKTRAEKRRKRRKASP